MDKQIKVSVIVPVYNVEKYIKKSLNSISNQTLKEIEVICVNDGSTDSSAEICADYARKDSRIKIIHQKNKGLGAARNAGMNLAKGEYIGFIDSDDTIDDNFFEVLYATALKTSADIVYTPFKYVIDNECKKENIKPGEYIALNDKLAVLTNGAVTNKIFAKDILKDLHFPEGCIYEDNLFLVSAICKSNRIVVIDGVYYYYLIKDNSLVTSKDLELKRVEDSLKLLRQIVNVFLAYNPSLQAKIELVRFCIRSFIDKRLQKRSFAKQFIACFESDLQMKQIAKSYQFSLKDRIFSVRKDANFFVIFILGIKIKHTIKHN